MAANVALELAAVAGVGVLLALTAVKKRGFVLYATLAMFVVAGLQFAAGFMNRGERLFEDLAWQFGMVDDPLQWYRLATHLFVHAPESPVHLIGNVFTFVLMGWPLEDKIGWKRMAGVFFISGMLGAVASSLFVFATQAPSLNVLNAPGIGASGAIFGVIGYFAARYPEEKVLAPLIVILARVPVRIAAAFALLVQAIVLAQISNPFIAPAGVFTVLAHLTSFCVGVAITRVPGLRAADSPKERAFHLDLTPLRELVQKPADKMEVEGIIKEDIPEVAQAKLEGFLKRARCPRCQGVVVLDGKKLTSDCGWSVEFARRASAKAAPWP